MNDSVAPSRSPPGPPADAPPKGRAPRHSGSGRRMRQRNLAVMHAGRKKPLDTLPARRSSRSSGRRPIKFYGLDDQFVATWGPFASSSTGPAETRVLGRPSDQS